MEVMIMTFGLFIVSVSMIGIGLNEKRKLKKTQQMLGKYITENASRYGLDLDDK